MHAWAHAFMAEYLTVRMTGELDWFAIYLLGAICLCGFVMIWTAWNFFRLVQFERTPEGQKMLADQERAKGKRSAFFNYEKGEQLLPFFIIP